MSFSISRNFNPRSPCGERRATAISVYGASGISIHAPLVGSDPPFWSNRARAKKFQSTLPLWGATIWKLGQDGENT
ncbi:hypothetical protein CLOSTMETH_01859 [[Clostridium] methylpentosum DSM 5476]|uniref:Uncharacterized protein n=1 Tax=[Clostridium] methylpentosum DSM 5476 TaxID=537013 RepID=C0EDD2_9FIRM|nr:hypothetical protein CLOSTMETH_01859 [[Clostridium] methylpentosum DSM 5476]